MFPTQLHARLAACDFQRNKSLQINLSPTWLEPYSSRNKSRRQVVDAGEVPGRLGIRAERWQEICGACSVRVVALGVEELGVENKA